MNKIVPMLAAAILLSGCAASSSNHSAGSDPGADRTLPTGTYLKRRSGQAPDASTVDKQQLENMQRAGAGTINI